MPYYSQYYIYQATRYDMHDLEEDPDKPSIYECMECGNLLELDSRPTECPECGATGAFRNQSMSLE